MKSDNTVLDIFNNGLPIPAFIKCNQFLIKENYKTINSLSNKKELLNNIWSCFLKVELILNDNLDLKYIKFKNETDKTMFLMRWN